MKKTYRNYEAYLNELYAEMYEGDWEKVKKLFGNLASEKVLWNNYQCRTIGSLQRKKDSVAFYSGYNDWAQHKTVQNET